MDKRFEELKSALFNWGTDYIEEFLGFEVNPNWEKDTIDNAMEADKYFEMLMGDEVEPRKRYIMENAQFVRNLDIA